MAGIQPASEDSLVSREKELSKAFKNLERIIRKIHSSRPEPEAGWSFPGSPAGSPAVLFHASIQEDHRRRGYVLMTGPVPENQLSDREVEIVLRLASGSREKDICAAMSIRRGTLVTHERRIRRKVGADSRARVTFLAPFLCSFREQSSIFPCI